MPSGVVTVIGPVPAPAGTVVLIWVAEATVKVALVPLNATAVAPVKFVPVIVTAVPAAPLPGVNPVIVGGGPVAATTPLAVSKAPVASVAIRMRSTFRTAAGLRTPRGDRPESGGSQTEDTPCPMALVTAKPHAQGVLSPPDPAASISLAVSVQILALFSPLFNARPRWKCCRDFGDGDLRCVTAVDCDG